MEALIESLISFVMAATIVFMVRKIVIEAIKLRRKRNAEIIG